MVFLVLTAMLAALVVDAYRSSFGKERVWRIPVHLDLPEPVKWDALAFHYKWNFYSDFDMRPTGPGPHCMCLFESEPDSRQNPYVRVYSCPVPETQDCDSKLRTWSRGRRYTLDNRHAYDTHKMTEQEARYMNDLTFNRHTEMSIEIKVHENGNVTPQELYIEGIKAEDYLRAMRLSK